MEEDVVDKEQHGSIWQWVRVHSRPSAIPDVTCKARIGPTQLKAEKRVAQLAFRDIGMRSLCANPVYC